MEPDLALIAAIADDLPAGVWVATGSEIASHWERHFPAATHLKLEPEIWRDYPGSLS